jgi:UDPglucose--hexose-1-phosphate uridylyltransferase
MSVRYGEGFSFNYYIAPGKDWYMRFVPRKKILGGFEVGTGVWVNTQDPKETMQFVKNHFENPDEELIRAEHMAEYRKGV